MSPHLSIWIMFIASFIIGYITMPIMLGFTSPNIRFHYNKIFSSILMACLMALIELCMHSHMLSIPIIIIYSITFISLTIILILILQNQWFIDETNFLNGMIEHHGMALVMVKPFLKSRHRNISTLANKIKNTQEKEIKIMDKLID